MEIQEDRINFPVSRRELNLIREMAGEFMLDFPDADVDTFVQRVTSFYYENFKDVA